MKVYCTDKALLRLRQVHDFIAQDKPMNAARFVDRLTVKAQAISQHPQSGRIVEKYQREDIRETFEGSYRIIYRIVPDRIDILAARHSARLIPRRIGDL